MSDISEPNTVSDYSFGQAPQHTYRYLSPSILKNLSHLQCRTVLEIGCGNGSLLKAIADQGMEVAGLDPSASGIAEAKKTPSRHSADLHGYL